MKHVPGWYNNEKEKRTGSSVLVCVVCSCPWGTDLAQTCCRRALLAQTCAWKKGSAMELFPHSLVLPPFPFPPGIVHLFMRQPCISGLSYLARTLWLNEKHLLTYISLGTINNPAFTETNDFGRWLARAVLLKRSIVCFTQFISVYCSEGRKKPKQTCSFLLKSHLDEFYFGP